MAPTPPDRGSRSYRRARRWSAPLPSLGFFFVGGFLGVAGGCESEEGREPPDLDRVAEAAVVGTVEGLAAAVRQRDWVGASAYFAPHGRWVLAGDSTLVGREAIRFWLEEEGEAVAERFRLAVEAVEGQGHVAWVEGSVGSTDEIGGHRGRYLALLRTSGSEPWFIHRMVWTFGRAPPAYSMGTRAGADRLGSLD